MQDVTSFVNSANPLSLAPSNGGETKKAGSEKTADAKSFMAIMLAQLAEATASKTNTKLSKESVQKEDAIKPITKETKEAKSVDEHLLEDLLKIASALKNGTMATVFPTLKSSSRLDKVLNSETALKEFGNVKNIGDVMSLSKKYDLGLEKLSFSKESLESLQKTFPTLTKSNFFEQLKHEITAQPVTEEAPKRETSPSISPLEKNVKKSETPAAPSALKELMSQENTVVKPAKVEIKASEAPVESKKASPAPMETVVQKAVAPTPTETIVQKAVAPLQEEIKPDKKGKVENQTTLPNTSPTEKADVDTKAIPATRIVEPKTENTHAHKGMVESVLQTIKVEKPISQIATEAEPIVTTPVPVSNEEIHKTESTETKITPIEIKTTQKQEVSTKQTLNPKESLGQFASDLREKIESYKPPVMKVELSLFPKSLGEVDVTLLTRGNNLHVSISSNTTTMTLFTQNQAEFKNALVNMGFTNLEMNFSDQRHKEQQHNSKNNGTSFFDEISEEAFADTTSVELVVPRYV